MTLHTAGLPDAPSGDCRHCDCPAEAHIRGGPPRPTDVVYRKAPTLMARLQAARCLSCLTCPGFDQENSSG